MWNQQSSQLPNQMSNANFQQQTQQQVYGGGYGGGYGGYGGGYGGYGGGYGGIQVQSPVSFPELASEEKVVKVAQQHAAPTTTGSAEASLNLKATVEYDAHPLKGNSELFSILSLIAPEKVVKSASRAPLDLVVVVDTSGSMQGEKIQLVQETLHFLCKQLAATDRLAVISFTSAPTRVTHLRLMTSNGKEQMKKVVDSLYASGGTDIGVAVKEGMKLLKERETENTISSILLLSDGQGGSITKQEIDEYLPGGTTIHSFGYGSDHDARVLYGIAEGANGTFTFVENNEKLGEAFAGCLGGLLSVAVQQVEVTLEVQAPHKLNKVHTTYPVTVDNSSAKIKVSDLLEGEKKDILFSVELAGSSSEKEKDVFATVTVKYLRVNDQQQITLDPVAISISRNNSITNLLSNEDVDLQRNRVIAAKAIKSAVKLYETTGSTEEVQKHVKIAKEKVANSRTKDNEYTKGLLKDLEECLQRYSSTESVNNGGYAWAQQTQQQHWGQRANCASNVNYCQSAQMNLQFEIRKK
eukprot:TRINITY_DN1170_c0_g1_i1.p1 TRINITY_DN1170_c0_g1~~TRINITY_DN1170_c0_g1_i1.p1  ORF type:complete len:525 (-),score=148.31 TRINITY_DN1170_c0_g1_i1:49-1623(-)